MPWAATAWITPAAIVPVTVPDAEGGQAGFPPPAQEGHHAPVGAGLAQADVGRRGVPALEVCVAQLELERVAVPHARLELRPPPGRDRWYLLEAAQARPDLARTWPGLRSRYPCPSAGAGNPTPSTTRPGTPSNATARRRIGRISPFASFRWAAAALRGPSTLPARRGGHGESPSSN